MTEALLIVTSVAVVVALIAFMQFVLGLFHRAAHPDLYAGSQRKGRGHVS